MAGEEIFHLSASELAKRIEAKKLSPVELTQTYLDRSQRLGPRYNAYALLTPEIALEQAKAAEKENPARPLSRPAARDSLRRKRLACCERTTDDLGREALCKPGIRLQRDCDRSSARRGRGDAWKSLDDRARGRDGLPLCFRILAG